jgi:hypothetical protein
MFDNVIEEKVSVLYAVINRDQYEDLLATDFDVFPDSVWDEMLSNKGSFIFSTGRQHTIDLAKLLAQHETQTYAIEFVVNSSILHSYGISVDAANPVITYSVPVSDKDKLNENVINKILVVRSFKG